MKILVTADPEIPVPPTNYGGIERIVGALIGEYRRLGHEIGFVGNRHSKVDVDFFAPWPGANSSSRWDTFKNMVSLVRSVRQFRPDVLHSFSRLAYMLPLMGNRLPKIMSYQREPTAKVVKWATKLAGSSLRFTGCSSYISDLGKKSGGRWEAIPNFVDLAKFDFVSKVPEDAPLVFLSRIEEIKGTHVAIDVAKRSGKILIIAGNHSADAKANDYWNNSILPKIDNDKIKYVGPVNDQQKKTLLGSACAMIVPIQWNEPFGIVFAESLACGTPIISCPRGALPEIVPNRLGLGNVGGLGSSTEDLIHLVSLIPQFSRESCRAHCEEYYSLSRVALEYLKIYKYFIEKS